eukprot:g1122.t1
MMGLRNELVDAQATLLKAAEAEHSLIRENIELKSQLRSSHSGYISPPSSYAPIPDPLHDPRSPILEPASLQHVVARLEEKVERQQAQLFQHQQLFDQLDPTGLLKGANLNGLHLPQWQRERLDDILAEVVTQQKRLTTDQEMQAKQARHDSIKQQTIAAETKEQLLDLQRRLKALEEQVNGHGKTLRGCTEDELVKQRDAHAEHVREHTKRVDELETEQQASHRKLLEAGEQVRQLQRSCEQLSESLAAVQEATTNSEKNQESFNQHFKSRLGSTVRAIEIVAQVANSASSAAAAAGAEKKAKKKAVTSKKSPAAGKPSKLARSK